jgi:hypothetical protein
MADYADHLRSIEIKEPLNADSLRRVGLEMIPQFNEPCYGLRALQTWFTNDPIFDKLTPAP